MTSSTGQRIKYQAQSRRTGSGQPVIDELSHWGGGAANPRCQTGGRCGRYQHCWDLCREWRRVWFVTILLCWLYICVAYYVYIIYMSTADGVKRKILINNRTPEPVPSTSAPICVLRKRKMPEQSQLNNLSALIWFSLLLFSNSCNLA